MKGRPDLGETPFQPGLHFFVDGSSWVIEGKRHNGYSIVDEEAITITESGQLPNNWSTQTCELFALNQVLKHLKNKKGTICTDSKYAFGVVHTFGKIWIEWGLINSRAKTCAWKINSTNTRELKTTRRNSHSLRARTPKGGKL
jgi:ribonuclease HI